MDGTLRRLERQAEGGEVGETVRLARALARAGDGARGLGLLVERLDEREARVAVRELGPAPPARSPREVLRAGTRAQEWSAPRTLDLVGAAVVVIERGDRPTVGAFDPRDGQFLHGRGIPPGAALDAVDDLLVTTTSTELVAHDGWTGERAWSRRLGSEASVWPGEGALALVSPDDQVELLELSGPAPIERARFPLGGRRPLALTAWGLLATSEAGGGRRLHALDLGDGRERWSVAVGSRRIAHDADGVVHEAPDGEQLELRDPDGRLRWRRPGRGATTLGPTAVVVAGDASVTALDRRTGEATPLLVGDAAPRVSVVGDVALIVERPSSSWGRPGRRASPTEDERVAAEAGRSRGEGASREGRLHAVDVRTGRRRWALSLGWRDGLQVAPFADRLLLLEEGGGLVALT